MRKVIAVIICALAARGQVSQAQTPYTKTFYNSGPLRIEAYLYTPPGKGPFPLIISNHGQYPERQDRIEMHTTPRTSELLTAAGYAVLIPERRGFGESDGPTFREAVKPGPDREVTLIPRLQAEADDVLAAVTYAKTLTSIDPKRIAIMGYSLGGIVTVFAASRSDAFVAVIDMAGGSLNWRGSAAVRKALPEAAAGLRIPILCMVAENDATTAAVQSVYDAARAHGAPSEIIIYPAFTPSATDPGNAPGHQLFTAEGIPIWGKDVLTFLSKYLTK